MSQCGEVGKARRGTHCAAPAESASGDLAVDGRLTVAFTDAPTGTIVALSHFTCLYAFNALAELRRLHYCGGAGLWRRQSNQGLPAAVHRFRVLARPLPWRC